VVLDSAVADFNDTAGDVEEEAHREVIEGVRLTELRTDGRPRELLIRVPQLRRYLPVYP
jgi:hypothetical protein